jgi:hypothetical protein
MPVDRTTRVFNKRRKYCLDRIEQISSALQKTSRAYFPDHLCAYVTGSYGRLEAHPHSDIDVFFVLNDADRKEALPRINEHHIYSHLAKICKQLKFPDFSNDGEYLRVHRLSDILTNMGSPADDFSNNFTARMLLLLESQPLVGSDTYDRILKRIIKDYCRDYPDHDADFRPVFLMNDIVRFWKTLCLNYESKRNLRDMGGYDRAKAQLRNLKLKFSRMATCYSMLVELIASSGPITPSRIFSIAKRTPIERLQNVVTQNSRKRSTVSTHVTELLVSYAWFLERTGRKEEEAIRWLQKEKNRKEAFGKAQSYGLEFFNLLVEVSNTDERRMMLRYLLI